MYINGVFEGGGIKGIAYIGAIRFLEERGYKFKFVGGASVGSLFSALISANFTSYEMEELIKNFDINTLLDLEKKTINKFINGIKQKGLNNIIRFEQYLFDVLSMKNVKTFQDLKLGSDYLLKIVVTDLTNRKMVIIPDELDNYNYSKDKFLVSKAVSISCSIPLIFTPYKMGNNVFVDGGVTNNFPINLFKNSDIPTIGFKLNEVGKLDNFINKNRYKFFKIGEKLELEQYNIVNINTKGYKITDFKKGLANYQELIKMGYLSMRSYFYKNAYK